MTRKIILTLFLVVLLSACSPSEAQIQAAIEKTLTAAPTATVTFIPTSTNTPEPTATATITHTPTLTPTETPTPKPTPDMRIIDEDPLAYLPKDVDLPLEGRYYLPNQWWMSINTNEEVIGARTVEKGREYVIETGRITGWWVAFKRGTRAVRMPDEVQVFVGKFATSEGAQLAASKYNEVESYPKEGWKYVDDMEGLGDYHKVTRKEKITSGGDKIVNYTFQFTYYNFMVSVHLYGYEKDISHEFALTVGKKVLANLQNAQLVFPPTATPVP